MLKLQAVLGVVLLGSFGSVLSAGTRCSQNFAGGQCLTRSMGCPVDYVEQPMYSNYVGCVTLDKLCCVPKQVKITTETTTSTTTSSPTAAPQCGLTSGIHFDRILGGVSTAPCDWPFVVSIRALLRDEAAVDLSTTAHACQGVLIDNRWVLTTAFCAIGATGDLDKSRILVVAAEYNVSQVDLDPSTGQPQEQVIRADGIFIHPGYAYHKQADFYPFDNPVGLNSHNVALIKLAEPINGKCSGAICLPTKAEANNSCQGYDECVITGWGFSTEEYEGRPMELLGARVRLSSREGCNFLTERLGLGASRPTGSICQSPLQQNADSCLGDEGGAVMCFNGRSWVVRALLPFNLCANNKYNVFVTDVHPYLDWIEATKKYN